MGAFNPESFINLALALLVSLSFHEASHALMAYWLGDHTAKNAGRLTLNPLRHLDPLGTIFLVFMAFSGFGIGWAKPVPVNPYNLRTNPKTGTALVALAGPVSNMLLAATIFSFVRSFPLVLTSPAGAFLGAMFMVNVGLAAFNLIPIPPLDGFSVLLGLLPNPQAYSLSKLAPYGPALLLLMIMFPGVFRVVFNPLASLVQAVVTFGTSL